VQRFQSIAVHCVYHFIVILVFGDMAPHCSLLGIFVTFT
jgi:hypothetical protein